MITQQTGAATLTNGDYISQPRGDFLPVDHGGLRAIASFDEQTVLSEGLMQVILN